MTQVVSAENDGENKVRRAIRYALSLMKNLFVAIRKFFGVCMTEATRDLVRAKSDIALLQNQTDWLSKRVDNLLKVMKKMTNQLDGVQASVVALQNAQAGFIQDAQRVLNDLQALSAKMTTGEDITAEAAAIKTQLDTMTAGINAAKQTLDAGDLQVAGTPVVPPVAAPATDTVPPVAS